MVDTLVLNASYEVLTHVTWQRAVCLVLAGEAEVHEADTERQIRSQHLTLPFPRVIRLVKYVFVKYTDRALTATGLCTKRGVLERDQHTCCYCAGSATTVDHIVPQSRGGKNTWENLVAACVPCNQRKADRTPEEAGMRLRWTPYRPMKMHKQQSKIWEALPV